MDRTNTDGRQQTSGHKAAKGVVVLNPSQSNHSSSREQPGHAEERRQAEGQSRSKITVVGNHSVDAQVELSNNTYRPKGDVEHTYTDNVMCGQYWRVGNEKPFSGSEGSDRDGYR